MIIRSAIGAFGAVAMLGVVAAALPDRTASKAVVERKEPPFGELTKAEFVPTASDNDAAGEDKAKLVKLASLATPPVRVIPLNQTADAPAVVAQTAAKDAIDIPPAQVQPPASPRPETNASTIAPEKAETTVLAMSDAKPDTSAQPPSPVPGPLHAPVATPAKAGKANAIDINRASEDTLDRLPGAGRIGHSIVKNRPYRTVDDLLHKRVLRLSAFQKIQGLIKAD